MTHDELHAAILAVVIDAAEKGVTAKQLSVYFNEAAKGMQINAAFNLSGDALVASLKGEQL